MVGCCTCCKVKDIGPGGNKETYCGPISLVIGILFCPFICCCPLDVRDVISPQPPTGTKSIVEF